MYLYDTPLSGCIQQSHTSWFTGDVQFKAFMVLYKYGNHGRGVDPWYVAHYTSSFFITETYIQNMCISIWHEEKVTHQNKSPRIYYSCTRGGHMLYMLYLFFYVTMCTIFLIFMLMLTRLPCITEWYKDMWRTLLLGTH